jgi:deoxycytidylate deaminase
MGAKYKFVAIVGLCGAGKTLASNFFVSKGYQYVRFGQIVLDEVKNKVGLRSDPALEKEIREGFRKKYGPAAMAILNKPVFDRLLKKGNVVGDGLYSWSEYKYLKQAYKDRFSCIAIQASPEVRYRRLADRLSIDKDMIHRPFSAEEAKKRDYDEIENIEKGGPIVMADVTILNNSSKKEFIEKLESLFKKPHDKKRISWDEYFMSMAILASTRSSCWHVRAGSVIVLDKRIIGTGYNGAPGGIKNNCLETGCRKEKIGLNYKDSLNTGSCIGVHAEMNALANISIDIHKGATLYTTIFPCPSCAKNLIAYNIKRVVYKKEYDPKESSRSKALFKEAGVILERLDLTEEELKRYIFNQTKVDFDIFYEK